MRLLVSRWWLVGMAACATLADTGGGDANQPNAAAGPFRDIRLEELGNFRVAPNALKDNDDFPRDISVIDVDGDPATLDVVAYVAHTVFAEGVEPDPSAPPNEIVRQVASDGRSFERQLTPVLAPDLAWEGSSVGAPSALTTEGSVWLYYVADGGIGLATSSDGVAFDKVGDGPVMLPEAGGWEGGAQPTNPFVMRLPDGRYQMLYEVPLPAVGSAIGEALSDDGIQWTRVGSEPLLAPRGPSGDPLRPHVDAVAAGSPCAVLATSSQGRLIQYVYYAALDDSGRRTIAMAARFGYEGPLSRADGPVFGSSNSLGPQQPWVMRYADFTLLFATQLAGTSDAEQYPAVAVGVAPATISLQGVP